MAVGIAPMAIFYIFACSKISAFTKAMGIIGEMGAIGS